MQPEQSPYQDQLVRGLTHRMNNILSLFHGYADLLLENEKLDKPTRDGLLKIKAGASAASELMDRTHSLVRPSALVWREIQLTEFVPMLRPVFDTFCPSNTELEIECAADVPPVWADANRIKTAIVELVRNACEATGPTGVVRIKVDSESGTGKTNGAHQIRWVSVSVIDHGAGIAPDAADKIFQPFFSTKKRQNATGLGLNVATELVQQLGGVIRHESKPGRTCFQILLPAHTQAG